MEALKITIDDGTGREFDSALKGTLPEMGDLEIITKDRATRGGKPMAILTFTVGLPNGTRARAQAVTTVALLRNALTIINAHYPEK